MFGSRLAIIFRLPVAADGTHDSLSEFTTLEYRYHTIESAREQTLLFAKTIDLHKHEALEDNHSSDFTVYSRSQWSHLA